LIFNNWNLVSDNTTTDEEVVCCLQSKMSKKDGNKPPNGGKDDTAALYYASVYRYTCLGHVRASSSSPGSENVCRGIRYGLQHAAESKRTIPKEHATQDFSLLQTSKDSHSHLPDSLHDLLKTHAVIVSDKEDDWKEVDCYGITNVEILVLQDATTNQSTVTAVAPHVTVGSSIKDVGTKEGSNISGTLHLGPLAITVDGGLETPEHEQQKQEPNKDNVREAMTKEIPDLVAFSQKVAENMVKGAEILKSSVEEEFPSRVLDAGQRVVGQVGPTIQRTGKVAKAMFHVWFDDSDDNDGGHS
jgi:hypothetical protein